MCAKFLFDFCPYARLLAMPDSHSGLINTEPKPAKSTYCPPKAVENQYYIRYRAGYLLKSELNLAGECPAAAWHQAYPQSQKSVENQYYLHVPAASRRAIYQNQIRIFRANAPNPLPLYLSTIPKSR